jgi:hypothetical protein
MTPIFLESESEDFAVFLKDEGSPEYRMRWSGEVYPIYKYTDGFYFIHENNSGNELDKAKARMWFEFSYCWRGVWEGRVYPKQEEFWGEDISIVSDLWDQIEKICKDKITADNPDYKHFD